jgi:hypothetical protein
MHKLQLFRKIRQIIFIFKDGPEDVSISGPDHVEEGEPGAFYLCTASPANPSPVFHWTVHSSVHGDISAELEVSSQYLP